MENTNQRQNLKNKPIYIYLLVVAALIIIVKCYSEYKNQERNYVQSKQKLVKQLTYEPFENIKIGNNSYKVHEDLQDPVKAAETMDRLNAVARQIIDNVYQKYITEPSGYTIIKPQYQKIVIDGIKSLKKNFRSANMEENIPERSGGDTSYVIDKGDVFAMCLRDPKNGNQIDPNFNALTFVLVHELSHLFTSTFGHDKLFWHNFRFLLQETTDMGLYSLVDYKANGSPYCGIVISYCPLHDKSLDDYRI